jgi:hypothetical protein
MYQKKPGRSRAFSKTMRQLVRCEFGGHPTQRSTTNDVIDKTFYCPPEPHDIRQIEDPGLQSS